MHANQQAKRGCSPVFLTKWKTDSVTHCTLVNTLHIFQSNYDSVLIGILSSNRAKRTYRNVRPKIVFSFDSTQKIPNFTCTTSAM